METTVTCVLCNSLCSNDDNSFPNTDEAKKNHARIHFQQSKILDYGITEGEILQRCFWKVVRPASMKECRQSLQDLCKSFLEDQATSPTTVCNMCGFKISGTSWRTSHNMVNHASAHLEDRLFECRHCDQSSSTVGDIRSHIRRAHKVEPTNEDFEDKTAQHFNEISKRIKRCFSTNYPRVPGLHRQFLVKGGCKNRNHRSIVDLCRSIFIQRSKPESLGCALCGSRIRLGGRDFQASAMYQHAAAHLDVKLFKCLRCEQSMSSKSAIRQHLSVSHQIVDGNSDNFDDQSGKFHSEHLNMIERCFSADQVKLEVSCTTMNKSSIKSEASTRSKTARSTLAVERRMYCHRLIRTVIDSDGKAQCSFCSKRLAVRYPRNSAGNTAYFHAESHLQKPLYQCKVCKNQFSTYQTVAAHLKTKHVLGMEKNYECIADEFHAEIMDKLAKCYIAHTVP